MILRFSVQNYLSFDDEQEISFVASKLSDRDDGLIDMGNVSPDLKVLPVAIVYGPNASGKSNLLAALSDMRGLVLHSHRSGTPDGGIGRRPFALRKSCFAEPTVFSIDFLLDNVRYHYGFSFDNSVFREEWLFFYPEGTRRRLFERVAGEPIKFGPSFKGEKKQIEALTRDNSLFVSAAAQNNHDALKEIFQFFRGIVVDLDVFSTRGMNQIRSGKSDVDERAIKFLSIIGTGIVSYRRKKIDYSPKIEKFQDSLAELIKESLSDEIGSSYKDFMSKLQDIELGHLNEDGEEIYFNLDDESAGTHKLLGVLSQIFSVLDTGGFVAADEIDVSVHSQVTEAIVALFSNKTTNPNGAQLLATTHDTNLMTSNILRRDEIWLVEKGPFGMSQLFPLTDIRTRKQDNIERGYLEGRYGAVPLVDINDVIAELGCGAKES